MKTLPLALLLFSLGAHAEQLSFQLDTAKSTVEFTLGDVLHTVKGSFQLKSGTVSFDPATGAASGSVVVDVKSGNTGSGARDRKMHKEILQSDQYPEAVFSPRRVSGKLAADGPSAVEVQGTLTIHGQDHDLTLPAEVSVQGGVVKGRATFVVPYVSWGMKNPSNFLLKVNDKVEVTLNLQGAMAPAKR